MIAGSEVYGRVVEWCRRSRPHARTSRSSRTGSPKRAKRLSGTAAVRLELHAYDHSVTMLTVSCHSSLCVVDTGSTDRICRCMRMWFSALGGAAKLRAKVRAGTMGGARVCPCGLEAAGEYKVALCRRLHHHGRNIAATVDGTSKLPDDSGLSALLSCTGRCTMPSWAYSCCKSYS